MSSPRPTAEEIAEEAIYLLGLGQELSAARHAWLVQKIAAVLKSYAAAEAEAAWDAAIEAVEKALKDRADSLFAWMKDRPLESKERLELSLRAGELYLASNVAMSLKGKRGAV